MCVWRDCVLSSRTLASCLLCYFDDILYFSSCAQKCCLRLYRVLWIDRVIKSGKTLIVCIYWVVSRLEVADCQLENGPCCWVGLENLLPISASYEARCLNRHVGFIIPWVFLVTSRWHNWVKAEWILWLGKLVSQEMIATIRRRANISLSWKVGTLKSSWSLFVDDFSVDCLGALEFKLVHLRLLGQV